MVVALVSLESLTVPSSQQAPEAVTYTLSWARCDRFSCTHSISRDMLWEEELEAKRIQDDEDRRRKVTLLDLMLLVSMRRRH